MKVNRRSDMRFRYEISLSDYMSFPFLCLTEKIRESRELKGNRISKGQVIIFHIPSYN